MLSIFFLVGIFASVWLCGSVQIAGGTQSCY